ncbi:MAG: histidine kinase dimerization/phosphoacceptor domain -containing protein [Saprospiraceae bacterium]|nr:histidine kinase dimerization/phosphoacceptor domain -containing protein [Saprospiraceae bacterium]
MKARIIFFCFICLQVSISRVCECQTTPKDSLLKFVSSQNDTLRINAYNNLSRLYIPDSLNLANEWADRALKEAEKFRYTKGIIYAYKNKGLVADYKGELEKAVHYYDKGIAVAEKEIKWKQERIDFFVNKGVAYYYAGDMGKALENYIEAEKLYANEGSNPSYGKLLNNLAAVYRNLKKYDDAIRIYQKSLSIKEYNKDSIGMANTLNNIGLVYAYLEDHSKTAAYLENAKTIYESLQEWGEAQSVNISLGIALNELGRQTEARDLLLEALSAEQLNINIHDMTQAKLLLAKIYYLEGNYIKANKLIQEIEPIIIKTNFTKAKATFYEVKAYILHSLNQQPQAYIALLEHKLYLDTLMSEDRLKFEKDMETKYLTREKENQIQIQELQILKSKRERLVYIFALIGLGIILGLAYRLSRVRKKANNLLSEKNSQIQKALEEKEILLKEIHHRVKNNLQIISSLLSLQSRQIEDPKALEAIQEGRNRVNSMALIHKNLYQDEDLVGVDAADYIDKLTESLIANYNINPNNITVKKDIDPLKLDVDTIIPLGLILNELISNSLKYAFTDNQQGELNMTLKRESKGLRLSISDNGQGLPPNFDIETLKSLGFRLVKAFTQKLEGVLSIRSDHGTNVEILIPNYKAI